LHNILTVFKLFDAEETFSTFVHLAVQLWVDIVSRNRSQVQGSTFSAASGHRSCQFDQKSDAGLAESHTRVKDKERIEDPKSSLKMLIFPSNCQLSSKFWIRPDEADAFIINT